MKNAIHMLESATHGQMNSIIITTKLGKVIVIDGGRRDDSEYLLNYLIKITGNQVPHVDAWFLTHPHNDHIAAFMGIMETKKDALTIDRIYFNFPSAYFMTLEPDYSAVATMNEFYACLPIFADKVCFCSGYDKIDIGDAHFDVLYSADFELKENVCNNASLVFRMTLGGKSAMFTGDCGVEAGQKILRLWKESGLLKSDICQMAHHGQNGCDKAFYEAVAPEICLWCTPQWLWDNDNGQGYNTHVWETVTVRQWMNEIGASTHLVTKDGNQVYSW